MNIRKIAGIVLSIADLFSIHLANFIFAGEMSIWVNFVIPSVTLFLVMYIFFSRI